MKVGKKSYMFLACVVMCVFAIAMTWVNVDKISASEEKAKITATYSEKEKEFDISMTLYDVASEEYILSYEGIEDLTSEAIEKGVDSDFSGTFTVEESSNGKTKRLFVETDKKSDATVSFKLKTKADIEAASLQLLNTEGEVLTESRLTEPASEEELKDMLIQPLNGLNRGANDVPGDPIRLGTVFRPAIGTGPTLLEDGKVLQITSTTNQLGAIWSNRSISLLKDFTFTSYIYLGNNAVSAGDGITFTLHNDPRINTELNRVIGRKGAALGAYGALEFPFDSEAYVQNALSVEFDTYFNGDGFDKSLVGVPGGYTSGEVYGDSRIIYGHVGIVKPFQINSTAPHNEHHAFTIINDSNNVLSNDSWRTLKVSWSAENETLSYYLEGVGENSYKVPNVNGYFGGTDVYWGFTGATGDRWADNRVAVSELPATVEQSLVVENVTNGTAQVTEEFATKDDQVRFTDSFTVNYEAAAGGNRASAVIQLPEGLDYKADSLKLLLNGEEATAQPIVAVGSSGELTISNLMLNHMIVEIEKATADGDNDKLEELKNKEYNYQIVYDANVSSTTNLEQLKSNVSLSSQYGSSWGASNDAIVKIKVRSEIDLHFKDQDTGDAIGSELIPNSAFVGDTLEYSVPSIDDYEYVGVDKDGDGSVDSASTQLEFAYLETKQNITFYYIKKVGHLNALFKVKTGDETEPAASLTKKVEFKDLNTNDAFNLKEEERITTVIEEWKSAGYLIESRPIDEEFVPLVPGGTVEREYVFTYVGFLRFASAPKSIEFGIKHNEVTTRMEMPESYEDLIVEDSRSATLRANWKLQATLNTPMTHTEDQSKVLVDAIRYKYNGEEQTLKQGQAADVHIETSKTTGMFAISDKWSATGDGLKLEIPAGDVRKFGDYQAEILWKLTDAY